VARPSRQRNNTAVAISDVQLSGDHILLLSARPFRPCGAALIEARSPTRIFSSDACGGPCSATPTPRLPRARWGGGTMNFGQLKYITVSARTSRTGDYDANTLPTRPDTCESKPAESALTDVAQ
jgi:hypothetical protein